MRYIGVSQPTGKTISDLDPAYDPAILWNRSYRADAEAADGSLPFSIALERPGGQVSRWDTKILDPSPQTLDRTHLYVERALKFLLWQKGGQRIHLGGCSEVAREIEKDYLPGGARAFDVDHLGTMAYGSPLEIIIHDSIDAVPAENEASLPLGRHLDGCRIGFDLGGSDRKTAAVIDGKAVFTEEIPWDPYFQEDPDYHLEGIRHSLNRAAEHLPRVDAIGGSAAGIYVDNQVRAASLFRGVPRDLFESRVQRIFLDLQKEWGGIPFDVANDGEVTALAGSMSLEANSVLGIAMGTSEAAGYVTPSGEITSWLNELAFCPVDYRPNGPVDEWSGDGGCGVQYFSQQAVGRLAPLAGIDLDADMPLPERLVAVQELAEKGDPRAARVFDTIGDYLGYTVPHYAEFYEIENILILGRVTSGTGGERIKTRAKSVLADHFPDLSEQISLVTPSEKDKRHGQAVAAASLPVISG